MFLSDWVETFLKEHSYFFYAPLFSKDYYETIKLVLKGNRQNLIFFGFQIKENIPWELTYKLIGVFMQSHEEMFVRLRKCVKTVIAIPHFCAGTCVRYISKKMYPRNQIFSVGIEN